MSSHKYFTFEKEYIVDTHRFPKLYLVLWTSRCEVQSYVSHITHKNGIMIGYIIMSHILDMQQSVDIHIVLILSR